MTTYAMRNGKVARRQLADELDRLDRVIDCLADNLNRAVADAVREGAKQAVAEAIAEAAKRSGPVPAATPEQGGRSVRDRLTGVLSLLVGKARSRVSRSVGGVLAAASGAAATARAGVAAGRERVRFLRQVFDCAWRAKGMLAVTAAVGAGGVAVAAASHTAATAMSGVGAASVAAAVQLIGWCRRSAA